VPLKHRIGEIGWHNFERLVKTLLRRVIGPGVTSFGGSKDDGRDASFTGMASYPNAQTSWAGYWVFQVKYVDLEDRGGGTAARSALKSAFRKEIQTICGRHHRADNYVLVTDVPLTSSSRTELHNLALGAGFTKNFATVDGNEVCEWLDIYPELRRSFPQLLGLADLNQIVHVDIYNRSKAFFEQWAPRLALFVETDAYVKARSVLSSHRFLVLDGPPEVGKSMIAAALAFLYASEGVEVYDVRSPDQLYTPLNKQSRQLFVADDAIGSIDLDPGKADAWARDLAGIVRSLDKDHFLIWTARHYILEEALAASRLGETLDRFPGEHEVVVEVGDLDPLEKAEMLYNHAKHAKLGRLARDSIRETAAALVRSANFTPERIRQLIEHLKLTTFRNKEQLKADILQFLRDPGARWAKAYRALSDSERVLLISLLDLEEPARLAELRQAYDRRSVDIGGHPLPFADVIGRLKHSFITVTRTYEGLDRANKHPSLRDLLLREVRDDPVARRRYIELTTPVGLASLIRGLSRPGNG
jgi:hypothetical protein